MSDGIKPRQAQTSLQQTEQPGNSIRPSRLVNKVREDELGGRVAGRRAGQHGDGDDHEAQDGPDEGRLGDQGQGAGHEGVDEEGDDIVRDVDEELVPALRAVARVRQGDDADDQLAAQQAARGHEGDPAGDVDPARDPAEDGHPLLPADDRDPVVLAAGRGVGGQELGEGGGERQVADAGRWGGGRVSQWAN